MHYFIDGYNLMFRVSAGDDLQKMRDDITQDLAAKINLIRLDATLVFDAQYQHSESSRSHINHLAIVFTAVGETADEFILDALKEEHNPSKHTVVTSDKKLAWLSKRFRANVVSVDEFIAWLNRRYKNQLRTAKKAAGKSKQAVPVGEAVAPQKFVPVKSAPSPSSSPEECFEYYLERFEKGYIALHSNEHIPKNVIKQRVLKQPKRPKVNKDDETSQSDMVRWLKVFQRSLDEDEFDY